MKDETTKVKGPKDEFVGNDMKKSGTTKSSRNTGKKGGASKTLQGHRSNTATLK